MSESIVHQSLVRAIADWVVETCGKKNEGCLYIDSPEVNSFSKPPVIGGFIPDLYCRPPGENMVVVGEAKTANDIESKHTKSQLSAFLLHCESFRDGMLVVAVPWHLTRLARNIVLYLMEREHCTRTKAFILDKLEG